MSSWLQQVAGKFGKAVDTVGKATGNRLPEWNLSESLQSYGGNKSNQGFTWVPKAYASEPTATQRTVTSDMDAQQQAFQNMMDQQRSGGGGGGMPSSVLGANTQSGGQPYDMINQQQATGNSQIDSDYETSMGQLSSAEQGIRGQAGTAEGQITNEAAATRTQLGQEQAVQEQGAQASLSTAEKQGTSAMQQARDLFRETQQQNNAQLSALGISSSSVSEALAERLGVETARRIAGVTGSLDEVRLNTTKELGRIKTYYEQKTTQVQDWVANEKSKIQNTLMAGLNQINTARTKAASDKASARANLLSQVQNQIYSLTQQQQQFDQSLQQWAAQKSAALQPIAQDPNYLNTLMSTANTFNQQFAPSGFTYLPQVSVNAKGQMTGEISPQKKATDPLEELYRQAGVTQ